MWIQLINRSQVLFTLQLTNNFQAVLERNNPESDTVALFGRNVANENNGDD